jgi:hypothetical protein
MSEDRQSRRHIFPQHITQTELFTSPRPNIPPPIIPFRDRLAHATALRKSLETVAIDAAIAKQAQIDTGVEYDIGLIVEFEGFPDVELAFDSLPREKKGIELLNVRRDDNATLATVFVPDGKLPHFEQLLTDYVAERRDKNGRRLDNSALLNTIKAIRTGSLRALWTDELCLLPADEDESAWWEVWLPVRKDRSRVVDTFRRLAVAQDMRVSEDMIVFPERTVVLIKATPKQLKQSMVTLNSIAELRSPKETADFFDSMIPIEQPDWSDELLGRTTFAESATGKLPYVCLLDTGANRGHPLLEASLAPQDVHTVDPNWGVDDMDGHGTGMSGLALFGDLTEALAGVEPIRIDHRLESVKLLPINGGNAGDSVLHGSLVTEAVGRPEASPMGANRLRVFSMAITARDGRERGRPSAWSAALDRLVSDAANDGQFPRLLVVSAGNIRDIDSWSQYPHSNTTDGIHDPGQAWNSLTVGACTHLVNITEPDAAGYSPVAAAGGLSPFSTTSATWERQWPLKPDLVFEGGNAGKDKLGAVWFPSLSLLTTNHEVAERLFTTTNATSAATALAARMAAQIWVAYPDAWPETVRALMVHSSEWTDEMCRMYLPGGKSSRKVEVENLIRHCGFGTPDLNRALWSASSALTLVIQEQLHPFRRNGSQESMRDMHLHRLPWPIEELASLGELEVELRVTLSYFIEPNPSTRGIRSRYRYESHGLRFEVMRPLESEDDFRARINAAARDEEHDGAQGSGDSGWLLGKNKRHRGSLHSDIWTGTAADLASRGAIGIYPAMGWWRTRKKLERIDRAARYALVVSIRTPQTEVDLYNAVELKIAQSTPIEIGTQPW